MTTDLSIVLCLPFSNIHVSGCMCEVVFYLDLFSLRLVLLRTIYAGAR